MGAINALDQQTAVRLLADVAERNQALDLIRQLDTGPDACRSRFVRTAGPEIGVEVPSRRGHLVPVHADEKVEAYFRLGHGRYWFATTVASRSSLPLSDELRLPVLLLTPPATVERRQRRQYYRVAIPVPDRLIADLWLTADAAGRTREAIALPSMEVADLSAGGMRLLWTEGGPGPAAEGETLCAALPLYPERAPLQLTGRVERIAQTAEHTAHLGVQFIGLDETPDGKAARDIIQHYVAEREREELRRMKEKR